MQISFSAKYIKLILIYRMLNSFFSWSVMIYQTTQTKHIFSDW